MKASDAIFSDCRKYRYSLWRQWSNTGKGYVMFIGLNPSIADETDDDRTVTRCINFAKAWGYDALYMTNLFAFCATNPDDMKLADEPIGRENDQTLIDLSKNAGIIVAAWGNDGTYLGRDQEIKNLLPDLYFLKLTKDGNPAHPLYLLSTLTPQKF